MENNVLTSPVTHSDGSVASDACAASDVHMKKQNEIENVPTPFGIDSYDYVLRAAKDVAQNHGRSFSLSVESASDLMVQLRRDYNLTLFVGEDGLVHGRLPKGAKLPDAAKPSVAKLKENNDIIAAILGAEIVQIGIDPQSAIDFSVLMRQGRGRLTAPVVYHRATGLCDMRTLLTQSAEA